MLTYKYYDEPNIKKRYKGYYLKLDYSKSLIPLSIRDLIFSLNIGGENAIKFEKIIEQNNGQFNRIVSSYKFDNKENIERTLVAFKLIFNNL